MFTIKESPLWQAAGGQTTAQQRVEKDPIDGAPGVWAFLFPAATRNKRFADAQFAQTQSAGFLEIPKALGLLTIDTGLDVVYGLIGLIVSFLGTPLAGVIAGVTLKYISNIVESNAINAVHGVNLRNRTV